MRSHQSRCLVLKRMDIGETDRLLTLLSEDLGKVRAINRGAKKPLSKLAGHLEPFALTECQLQEGRSFYTITAAATIEPYADIRGHLSKTSRAYYLLEMVDALIADAQPVPGLFGILTEALDWLEALPAEQSHELVTAVFSLKLLTELGYRPELYHCLHCQTKLKPSDNRFSLRLGGILGVECGDQDGVAAALSPAAIKAMRFIVSQPIKQIDRLMINRQLGRELDVLVTDYLHYHTGRELRSINFLRQSVS